MIYQPYERAHRCGGQVSYHGSCGAPDCEDCFPGCNDERETERDLDACGYTFCPDSGEWCRRITMSVHTARRDHQDGRIKHGQHYRRQTWRYVNDETGCSYHVHRKTQLTPNQYITWLRTRVPCITQ